MDLPDSNHIGGLSGGGETELELLTFNKLELMHDSTFQLY